MNARRRRLPLPDLIVRCLAWLCLLLAVWPTFISAAATAAVPVVTNIAGAVQLRSSTGRSRDIVTSQIIHSGDMLVTGLDSLAVVNLADVGRVRLGPGTTTTAKGSSTALAFSIASGSLCVQSDRPAITVQSGPLAISAAANGTIFNLRRDSSGTKLAVYEGQVSTRFNGKESSTVRTGEALSSSRDGAPQSVPIQTLTSTFTSLHCPDSSIIALAMATPGPSPAAAPGGGGGGGGVIGLLLGLAGLAALAGGHGGGGGGGSSPQPSPSTSSPPGSLTVTPGSLSFAVGGAAQPFTASESSYQGPINITSSGDPAVATVAPSTGSGPSANFSVTPVGPGTTSITVSDNHGQSKTVSITVTRPAGTLSVNPTSLAFSGTGSGNNQSFKATESNYSGLISATTGDPNIATVAPASGLSGQSFTVTPIAPGSTSITVMDDHLGTVSVTVNVATPGSLALAPNSLSFNSATSPSQISTASESSYSGGPFFTNDINCSGIVSISPSTGTGPSQDFTVTPQGAGGPCSVAISDNHGGLQTLTATVFAPPIVSPLTLPFSDVLSPQSVNVSETTPTYSGAFSVVNSNCSSLGLATVGPPAGPGPNTTVPVTPLTTTASGGNCQFRVKDVTHGGVSGFVTVTIGPFGPVAPSVSSLSFSDVGSGSAQPFTVSETGYSGNFTVDGGPCAGIATVSPASGTTFTVTPVAGGGPCNINIADDHTQTAAVSVTVGPFGPVSPTPNTFSFTTGGTGNSFNVSESGYTGLFNANASSCGTAASVSAGPATSFTVTPGSTAGNCAILVSDDHSQTAKVRVFVTSGGVSVSPQELQFSGPLDAAKTFIATSAGAASLTATSNDATIATVAPIGPQPGSSVTFTVTPVNNGRTFIVVTDNLGGQADVSIGVGMSPLVNKRHPISATPAQKHVPAIQPAPPQKVLPIARRPLQPFGQPTIGQPIPGNQQNGGLANHPTYGALTAGALSVIFRNAVAPQSLAVFELNYSGVFTAVSTNPNVVTVGAPTGSGPNAWLTLTPHNPGMALVHITDDHGGTRDVFITVQPPELLRPPVHATLPGHPPTNP